MMTAIRLYRERAGMTQESLAAAIGVTQAAVSMWEAGNSNPDIITAKKIAQALACSVDELLAPIDTEQIMQ